MCRRYVNSIHPFILDTHQTQLICPFNQPKQVLVSLLCLLSFKLLFLCLLLMQLSRGFLDVLELVPGYALEFMVTPAEGRYIEHCFLIFSDDRVASFVVKVSTTKIYNR